MSRQLVQRGQTQTLVTYPVVRPGEDFVLDQPSAATAAVETEAADTAAAACTRDTASTVVNIGASEGDTSITLLAAIAQVRGRRLLLRATSGEQFMVRCALTQTSATLNLSSPIPMALPQYTAVRGVAISRALTALETAQDGPAKVQWTATISGQVLEWTEAFEVVRRVPRWELDEDELTRRFPEVLALRERNDLALDELRDAALEEELLPRLRARKIREADIVSTWPLVPAHVAACALFLMRGNSKRTKEDRDEARSDLEQKIDLALADVDGWYDSSQDEEADVDDARADFTSLGYSR